MKLEEVPECAQNVFVVHELLRRCGIANEDIQVIVDEGGQVMVQAKRPGREFNVGVYLLGGAPGVAASMETIKKAKPLLKAGVAALNEAPDEHLHKVFAAFFERHPPDYRAGLVVALIEAGFKVRPNAARRAHA